MDAALEGIRVVTVANGIAGAYCTKLLADYGADVVVVEPLDGGTLRRFGPFADPIRPGESGALHLYLNTNKRSVTLDLRQESGRALLLALLERADVWVDDRPPADRRNAAIAPQVIEDRCPQLVSTSITPFGLDGPYADFPAENLTLFAAGGQMAVTGDADREPLCAGGYQADYQAGLNGFTATLAGLWAASESTPGSGEGGGDAIDLSAFEAMASVLEAALNNYLFLGVDITPTRRGNQLSAAIGLYPCADGYLGVHAMPRNWVPLTKAMGAEWLATDERFRDRSGRVEHEAELKTIVAEWAAGQEKRAAYAVAGPARAPVSYVHDMQDLLDSPHLQARGYLQEIDHPVAGPQTYPGPPIRMSETPWRAGRAPLLGEHTVEVLETTLGLSGHDLDVLRGQGVI